MPGDTRPHHWATTLTPRDSHTDGIRGGQLAVEAGAKSGAALLESGISTLSKSSALTCSSRSESLKSAQPSWIRLPSLPPPAHTLLSHEGVPPAPLAGGGQSLTPQRPVSECGPSGCRPRRLQLHLTHTGHTPPPSGLADKSCKTLLAEVSRGHSSEPRRRSPWIGDERYLVEWMSQARLS